MPNAEGRMEETHHILARYNVTHPTDAERCLASEIATLLLLRQGDKQALAAARADVAAVEAACFEVCRDNTREALGDDADPDLGRFVCVNEDGDPIIEADTPADVVRQMNSCWAAMGERFDRLSADYAAARAENERMRADLDAVRKVEEWHKGGRRILHCQDGRWTALELVADRESPVGISLGGYFRKRIYATGDSYVALGRALAAQEGTR